jgi:prepilin-type N-terminal cleavage/methylation domain-containing protein
MVGNQRGFTLIEIIAVLIILGILAAVAIPKFLDLQDQSRRQALLGALAAGASQITMQYSKDLFNGKATVTTWIPDSATYTTQLGDFSATITQACGNNAAVVTINPSASGSPTWVDSVPGTAKTKQFTVCGP